jgi:hypothetical protein
MHPPPSNSSASTSASAPVHANKDVHAFAIGRGSIHGIIGENGAGKSTLMSILYRLLPGRQGRDPRATDSACRIRSSSDAIALGIGMVHQHFMLVDPFTVLENVVLGAEGGALIGPALAKASAELTIVLRHDYELDVDPDALVGELARRPAAARGDPQGAVTSGADIAHPRRAHRRIDARRRPIISSAILKARCKRPGQDRHPHHPQAARDHGHHRSCLGDTPRRDGGNPARRKDTQLPRNWPNSWSGAACCCGWRRARRSRAPRVLEVEEPRPVEGQEGASPRRQCILRACKCRRDRRHRGRLRATASRNCST